MGAGPAASGTVPPKPHRGRVLPWFPRRSGRTPASGSWCTGLRLYSLYSLHGASPRCLSPMSLHGASPRYLSPMSLHGASPGVSPRCLSTVPLHGASPRPTEVTPKDPTPPEVYGRRLRLVRDLPRILGSNVLPRSRDPGREGGGRNREEGGETRERERVWTSPSTLYGQGRQSSRVSGVRTPHDPREGSGRDARKRDSDASPRTLRDVFVFE